MQPVQRMQWAIDYPGLSTSQKLVLVYLAHHAGKGGQCWPSLSIMAEKLNMQRWTVQKAVRALESIGAVVCVKRSIGRVPSRYRLVFDENLQPPNEEAVGKLQPPSDEAVEPPTQEAVETPNRPMRRQLPPNQEAVTRQELGKKKRSPKAPLPEMVAGVNSDAWDEYTAYRRERKLPKLKPTTVTSQWKWLVSQGDENHQAAIIEQTIRQGWQGLFELKTERPLKGNGGYQRPSTMDRAMESFRRHGLLEEDHEQTATDADARANPDGASTTAFLAGSRRPRSNRGNDGT